VSKKLFAFILCVILICASASVCRAEEVELIYQSVEQLRSIRPLSLDTPPMIVPISFAGVEVNEDGLIAEKDLMALLREKIDALDKIVDEYTEEEMADAA
jgi:hypothetical protein